MNFDPIAAVVGIAVIVGGLNLGRGRRQKELIRLGEQQAEALRHQTDDLRSEMADNDRRCQEKIAALTADNAELRGMVVVLQEQQTNAIAGAMAPMVAREVVRMLDSGDWGGE